MINYTTEQAHADHMKRLEKESFAPGKFVMLHPDGKAAGKPHPDAGRIRRIVSSDGNKMVVEFWSDELVGSSTFCLIPRPAWAPVPEFLVEEYTPRAKKRGWRIHDRGVRVFDGMGWAKTAATTGDL